MLVNRYITLVVIASMLILPHSPLFETSSGESIQCEGLECAQSNIESQVIVLREATAVWCDVCAEVDPEISSFVDERSEQVTRIALHPDDGLDMLGTRFSTQQSWQMGVNPIDLEYPTYWMGDSAQGSGPVESDVLHRQFLGTAGGYEQDILITTYNRYWYGNDSNDYFPIEVHADIPLTNDGRFTFIITEDNVEVERPDLLNGIRFHDDVARAGIVLNSTDGSIIFSEPQDAWIVSQFVPTEDTVAVNLTYRFSGESLNALENLSLTVIAEDSDGLAIAAATTPRVVAQNNSNSLATTLALIGLSTAGVLMAIPSRKSKVA